jgi:hypothetical protein
MRRICTFVPAVALTGALTFGATPTLTGRRWRTASGGR